MTDDPLLNFLTQNAQEHTILNSGSKFSNSYSNNDPGRFTQSLIKFFELISVIEQRYPKHAAVGIAIVTGFAAITAITIDMNKEVARKKQEELNKRSDIKEKLEYKIMESAIEFSKKGLTTNQYASILTSDNCCDEIAKFLKNKANLNYTDQRELNSFQNLCQKKQQYDQTILKEAESKSTPLERLHYFPDSYFYPYNTSTLIKLDLPEVYLAYPSFSEPIPKFPEKLADKLPFFLNFNKSAEYKYLKKVGDKTFFTNASNFPIFGPSYDLISPRFNSFKEKIATQAQTSNSKQSERS